MYTTISMVILPKVTSTSKGAFTLANFARDFALSLQVLLDKNYLFSLLNVQASAKSRQCKRTLRKVCYRGHYRTNLPMKIRLKVNWVYRFQWPILATDTISNLNWPSVPKMF
jgi:hypothetical protein